MQITLLCIFLLWPVRVWKGKKSDNCSVCQLHVWAVCNVMCISDRPSIYRLAQQQCFCPPCVCVCVCVCEKDTREKFVFKWQHASSLVTASVNKRNAFNACEIYWCVFLYEKYIFVTENPLSAAIKSVHLVLFLAKNFFM